MLVETLLTLTSYQQTHEPSHPTYCHGAMTALRLIGDAAAQTYRPQARRDATSSTKPFDFRLDQLLATGPLDLLRASTALSRLAFAAQLMATQQLGAGPTSATPQGLASYQLVQGQTTGLFGRLQPLDLAI